MRKPLKSLFILSILTLSYLSCKENKVISETEFEQAVFYEFFPSIIDSIHYDKRLLPPPPPPPEFFEKEEYKILKKYPSQFNYINLFNFSSLDRHSHEPI